MRAYFTATLALLFAVPALAQLDRGQMPAPPAPRDGSLLRVDPTYFRMASETGGDFYFWEPGEFAGANLKLPLNAGDPVALGYGTFHGETRTLDIPVEANVARLTVFAGAQRKYSARLLQPDGREAAGAGTTRQVFAHMLLVTVNAPTPGVWRLQLAGQGLYSMSSGVVAAAGSDSPYVPRLQFVEMAGRPGHEGWFPIEGEPRSGQWLQCMQAVRGNVREPRFRFVDGNGTTVGEPALRQEEDGGDFLGRCKVPAVPFRTMTTGTDDQGHRVQRIEPGLHVPAPAAAIAH
jgi:hypothetical protein